MNQNFYITTTLPYVNSDPHIGFALEIVQADAIARLKRLQGYSVTFNTGTDEHGLKIFRKAEERGVTPQEYCDEYAAKFKSLKENLNLSYTNFIRTTDAHHIEAAQEFWKKCEANGDIYKKNYQVKYCVGCELEKTESELNEENRCPIHPNLELELIDEENYFFKFSKYQEPLLELYKSNSEFVLPPHRQTEIKNFTEKGLEDFSISRLKEKMPWGVPVPNDPEHVMYVWFDALVNYVSTINWPNKEFEQQWPGIQIAGKDNLRQQSNMWQGMLMSAGIKPSQKILIHGFITSEGQKMSKSLGNVVNPIEVSQKYGIDALRYYLLREIPTYEDGDFSEERFIQTFNTELANNLGNLINRVTSMTERYFDGQTPDSPQNSDTEKLSQLTETLWTNLQSKFDSFEIKSAIEEVIQYIDFANKYIEDTQPWKLAKENTERLAEVMYNLLEMMRQISNLLIPAIPEAAKKIQQQISSTEETPFSELIKWGQLKPGTQIKKADQLFPRIETEEN